MNVNYWGSVTLFYKSVLKVVGFVLVAAVGPSQARSAICYRKIRLHRYIYIPRSLINLH